MGAILDGAELMRDMIVGTVLAIIFVALLFAAPQFLPSGIDGLTRAEIAQIGAGFSGTKYLGHWTLACAAPHADAVGAGAAPSQPTSGRCRMQRGYYRGGQLLLVIAFRYAGPGKELAMIVRYPAIGRKGEYLTVALASKLSIRLPVYGCAKAGCVAVGGLIPAAQSLLEAAPQAQIVLPRAADGKQYTISVALDGLAPALDGMHRAEL
jgi:invasion protein IalB